MKIFITGASGYIGGMLTERFSARPDVELVVCLDKEPPPELLESNKKILWITANTADDGWQDRVSREKPEVVIHAAWQIREMYGNRQLQWRWNVEGSEKVFDFAFCAPGVKKLIHFSTVASYGSYPENTTEHRFTEDESLRESDYLYAEEKRIVEERLARRYKENKSKDSSFQAFIVRPAAVTGLRGRYMRVRFGLQAALSGSLKGQKSFLYDLISIWVYFVPVTPKWLRQYVHEDDVHDIIALLAFKDLPLRHEIFNIAPPGEAVRGIDMAGAVGRKMLPIYPWMVRAAFFLMWRLTRGRVPTSPGSWKGYSYPIAVDGSKITRLTGFQYRYSSKEAFKTDHGYYSKFVHKKT